MLYENMKISDLPIVVGILGFGFSAILSFIMIISILLVGILSIWFPILIIFFNPVMQFFTYPTIMGFVLFVGAGIYSIILDLFLIFKKGKY